jgi:hypothetical protein
MAKTTKYEFVFERLNIITTEQVRHLKSTTRRDAKVEAKDWWEREQRWAQKQMKLSKPRLRTIIDTDLV